MIAEQQLYWIKTYTTYALTASKDDVPKVSLHKWSTEAGMSNQNSGMWSSSTWIKTYTTYASTASKDDVPKASLHKWSTEAGMSNHNSGMWSSSTPFMDGQLPNSPL